MWTRLRQPDSRQNLLCNSVSKYRRVHDHVDGLCKPSEILSYAYSRAHIRSESTDMAICILLIRDDGDERLGRNRPSLPVFKCHVDAVL